MQVGLVIFKDDVFEHIEWSLPNIKDLDNAAFAEKVTLYPGAGFIQPQFSCYTYQIVHLHSDAVLTRRQVRNFVQQVNTVEPAVQWAH